MSELYHYGVKGQKWGVRRQKVREFVRSNSISRYTQKLNAEKKKLNSGKEVSKATQTRRNNNIKRISGQLNELKSTPLYKPTFVGANKAHNARAKATAITLAALGLVSGQVVGNMTGSYGAMVATSMALTTVGAFTFINRTESEDQTYNRRSKKK